MTRPRSAFGIGEPLVLRFSLLDGVDCLHPSLDLFPPLPHGRRSASALEKALGPGKLSQGRICVTAVTSSARWVRSWGHRVILLTGCLSRFLQERCGLIGSGVDGLEAVTLVGSTQNRLARLLTTSISW